MSQESIASPSDEDVCAGSEDTDTDDDQVRSTPTPKQPSVKRPVRSASPTTGPSTVSASRVRKSKAKVPSSPFDLTRKFSSLFYTAEAESRFNTILHRSFIVERKRDSKVFEQLRLASFFTERNLDICLDFPKSYSRSLVLEFYANLSQDLALPHSPNFHRIFVRDKRACCSIVHTL